MNTTDVEKHWSILRAFYRLNDADTLKLYLVIACTIHHNVEINVKIVILFNNKVTVKVLLYGAMFRFAPNPLAKSTFWSYLLCGLLRTFLPYISSQSFVQRFSTVSTRNKARE